MQGEAQEEQVAYPQSAPSAVSCTEQVPAEKLEASLLGMVPPRTLLGGQISTYQLIQLCRRVATSAKAGIDYVRIFQQETKYGNARQKQVMQEILEGIMRGGTLTDAMRETGYFPALFVEMTAVGEQTGKLDEVYFRLAEHYDHLRQQWMGFLMAIAWPAIQLTLAIFIIAGVIWLPSALTGQDIDILGVGLTGSRGVMLYFLMVGFLLLSATFVVMGLSRGWFGLGMSQLLRRVPVFGQWTEAQAMSRLCWALSLAHESGMSAKRTVLLALGASQNDYYSRQSEKICLEIQRGKQFHEAFAEPNVFPEHFLTSLQTAEISGTITESMNTLATEYDRKATTLAVAIKFLSTAVVVGLVAVILVLMIFQMFSFYLKQINDALNFQA